MIEAIVAAIKATKDVPPSVQFSRSVAPAAKSGDFAGKLNSLGLADEIAGRVDGSSMSGMDKVLLGVIAAQIIGLGYIIFFM
jgi:hypothetical protein